MSFLHRLLRLGTLTLVHVLLAPVLDEREPRAHLADEVSDAVPLHGQPRAHLRSVLSEGRHHHMPAMRQRLPHEVPVVRTIARIDQEVVRRPVVPDVY